MQGDSDSLFLSSKDKQTIANVKSLNIPYTIVLITGRPFIVTDEIEDADAFVVAWLPGTEGNMFQMYFGDVFHQVNYHFHGLLTWQMSC